MKAIICDRCRKVVVGCETDTIKRIGLINEDGDVFTVYELCETCEKKLKEWLKGEIA